MPELPELQALAEGLTAALADRDVEAVHVWLPSVVKSAGPEPSDLVGQRLLGVQRRGKLLVVHAARTDLVIHLMQAGRLGLYPAKPRTRPVRRLLLTVDSGGEELRLRELSTEHRASVWVVPSGELDSLRVVAALGPEPVGLSAGEWRAVLGPPSARLHTALRDGRRVAGIGRCYASEIMWAARLAPFAAADRLTEDEIERLARAADTVLTQATNRARERISTRLPDREERITAVHRHAGEPCLRCATRLERVSFSGYELVYCPTCQTGGRTYADRRTSRFLR
jgi:formamidopyrimidine-DNA glycosylase